MSNPPQTLFVGLGSPHGDDQIGWLIADRLAAERGLPGTVAVRKAAIPLDLLDWLEGVDCLHVCDALQGPTTFGEVQRWEWADASLSPEGTAVDSLGCQPNCNPYVSGRALAAGASGGEPCQSPRANALSLTESAKVNPSPEGAAQSCESSFLPPLQGSEFRFIPDTWGLRPRPSPIVASRLNSGDSKLAQQPDRARYGTTPTEFLPASTRLRSHGSHDFGLPAVLDLAARLQRLPRRIVVWAIAGADFEPGSAVSAELIRALPTITTSILEELNHARDVSRAVAAASG